MGSPMSPTQGPAEHDFASHRFVNESSGDSNAGRPWCKNTPQINGDSGYVMGTFSWPPLSESTRPVTRSSSDSTGPAPEGSVSSSSEAKTGAPLISQPPQRQAHAHSHSNSSTNNSSRPRSKTRGVGGSSGSGPPHNTFHRPSPPAPPPFPGFDLSYRPSPSMLDVPRTGIGSNPRNNTSRRGNYGPRPRGDTPPHQNHYGGVRRHQERRGVNIPSPHMTQPRMGYMPPAPLPPRFPPYMTHPPVGLFPGQLGFEMASPFMYMPPLLPPEPFRTMPVVPPPQPPMLFPPASENTLTDRIIKQTNYYFSDDNLAKDNYLRSKMDDQGWVPISLIASFHRVEQLTKDIQVIMDALRHSTVLELQGEKIRSVTWKKWVRSSQPHTTVTPGPSSADDSKNNYIDRKDVQD